MSNKFAIIGDIHDSYNELCNLLQMLGLEVAHCKTQNTIDRQIVFTGDLVDRGKNPVMVLKLAMDMANKNQALFVRGNHDDKLYRALNGNRIKMNDDLALTLERVKSEGKDFTDQVFQFLSSLPYYQILDDDSLYVVHGAGEEHLQGLSSNEARAKALYAVTTGRYIDGYPERLDWGKSYKGRRAVVYGHQIVDKPKWVNNTIDIDTGCFKTGILSCVLWPERTILQIEPQDID